MMNYPSLDRVNAASQRELGTWLRFLKSPGMNAIDHGMTGEELDEHLYFESKVLARIGERFEGWNPQLSKSIGWDKPL
jgi:hypothetical protein